MINVKRWFSYSSALVCCLSGWSALGQAVDESLSPVPSGLFSSLPSGWSQAGSVSMSPYQADVKTKTGSGIIVGKQGTPVTLLTNAKDVRLVLDVMVSPGADGVLSMGGTGIRIADSWAKPGVNGSTFGAVMGSPVVLPSQNVSEAPGIWQRLEVTFQSGKPGTAVLDKVTLNGILIHENLVVPGASGASAGTVSLNVTAGTIAVRPVGYQLISDRKVAKLSNVRYKLYENKTETKSVSELANLKLVKEDTVSTVTYEVSYGQPRWHGIVFTGDLEVEKAGVYTLALQNGGYAGLEIDDKEVVPNTYLDLGRMNTGKVNLSAGKHAFTLFFGRSWPRPGLGMFIAASDTKFQPLHTRASLPEPDPVGTIAVLAKDKPELVRSFVQMAGEKGKRTHCLSVGTPSGLNYTIDLNKDALLQVWRGKFADVTEMWYERGEPQLLFPMGVTVPVTGQGSLAVLSSAQQAWPDSLSGKDFDYKGWKLDADGNPTTQYAFFGGNVADALRPDADGKGLTRTLTLTGVNQPVYCRMAAGSSVEEVSKGLYRIGDSQYFVRLDAKAKPVIRSSGGKQELLLPVTGKDGSASVSYSIVW